MFSFEQLVYEAELIDDEKINDYLSDFFCEDNYSQYIINEKANEKEIALIEELFISKKDLLERALDVYEKDKLCLEAFYICYRLAEETQLSLMFNSVYNDIQFYENFNAYKKEATLTILNLYTQFLLNIHNITLSTKVLKTIIKLEGHYSETNVARLSYLYCLLENKNDFYDLYLTIDFKQSLPYLLLMVTLLKHGEELKAKEVFSDLLSKNKYAEYIDHIWDLEDNYEQEAIEFKNTVEICFEEICAIPYFFSWCKDNKEISYKS